MTQKTPTQWRFNPIAWANVWTYNQTGITYNQVGLTYNGIVTNEEISNDKTPTVWSKL
jgi:hypothetical protein